jgi:hypothetical protein
MDAWSYAASGWLSKALFKKPPRPFLHFHTRLIGIEYLVARQAGANSMDELMEILRGMRTDADQAIQLLTSGHHRIENTTEILERIRAWREEIDGVIQRYGDPREERA